MVVGPTAAGDTSTGIRVRSSEGCGEAHLGSAGKPSTTRTSAGSAAAAPLPPFRTGPSNIARYFFHDCDRFFRFTSTRTDAAAAHGVPRSGFDTSPVMQAILQAGYGWEEQAAVPLTTRRHRHTAILRICKFAGLRRRAGCNNPGKGCRPRRAS